MPDSDYSDDELHEYFRNRESRRKTSVDAPPREIVTSGDGAGAPPPEPADASSSGTEDDAIKATALRYMAYGAVAITAFALGFILFLAYLSTQLPSLEQIENPRNLLSTTVMSADGIEMARYYQNENRTWVPLDSISVNVTNALIATEDRAFYDHWGVHLRRTLSAPFHIARGSQQGGSTITQQLARNLYREVGMETTITRKLKEILTAIQLERTFTKSEIIEAYLNTVPFRYNAFGIEMAAQTYYSKNALDLEPQEAAVLVGMLAANTRFDPVRNPNLSQQRRNIVLSLMADVGYLQREDARRMMGEPIELSFRPYSHTDNLAPHFAEHLRLWLHQWARQNGYDPYADGLQVHTTIDSRIQEMARLALEERAGALQAVVDVEWGRASGWSLGRTTEPYVQAVSRGNVEPFEYFWTSRRSLVDAFVRETAAWRGLRAQGLERDEATARLRQDAVFMDSLRTSKTRLESGLVALDPNTGHIKAWVGGRDFVADKYDHVAIARRQSGSTFKPFVWAAAVDNGYSPQFMVLDAPFTWVIEGSDDWRPSNAGGSCGCYRTLAQGLARSSNLVAARLTRLIGPEQVATYAEKLGIQSPLESVPSIGLGVADVTLLEMTAAYATMGGGGIYHEPQFVTRIEDRFGNVLATFEPQGREALNPSSAYTMVDMMRGTITAGTGGRIRSVFGLSDHDLAGKTGTTQNSADGWFLMMHPDLAMGAWVGFNDRRISFRSSYWGQGGNNALYLVGDFARRMARTDHEDVRLAERRFEEPENYQPPTRLGSYSGPGGDRAATPRWRDRTQDRELDWLFRGRGGNDGGSQEQPAPRRDRDGQQGRIGW
ncbi:transglycosylase domain-containing protein [soil metagenome]